MTSALLGLHRLDIHFLDVELAHWVSPLLDVGCGITNVKNEIVRTIVDSANTMIESIGMTYSP